VTWGKDLPGETGDQSIANSFFRKKRYAARISAKRKMKPHQSTNKHRQLSTILTGSAIKTGELGAAKLQLETEKRRPLRDVRPYSTISCRKGSGRGAEPR